MIRVAVVGAALAATGISAQNTNVTGGQTSVLLDTALLASAAGLSLSSVSPDVIAPGELGPDSVAFGINARDGSLPTTFSYDASDFLGTFGGTIEHAGSVFFNADAVEVGDFTIGFDAGRAGGDRSGFFVESTTGVAAILFDVANPSNLVATPSSLLIEADLLVSAEFAGFLGNSALTGADVGDARVSAVPAPASAALLAGLGLTARRRR